MFYIVTCPKAYSKLQAEIDAAAERQHISFPIADAEAKTLPYLQAYIKEGLGIWPPVTGLISKKTSEGGDFINRQFIPSGTKVTYCAWGVFRDKTIWGDDANSFRPERWLEAEEERLKITESTAETLFSPGRWQCLGKSIALIELNKVFVDVATSLMMNHTNLGLAFTSL
jgi:cytochrome P450